MTLLDVVILVVAGIIGGGVNAIAGGGTFFTFPALMAVGLDPLTANVSNALAIYPGHAAAVPAYRKELRDVGKSLIPRCLRTAVGGLIGAVLLLQTGATIFSDLVPYLILAATMLFAFGSRIRQFAEAFKTRSNGFAVTVEFIFAVYGGFFGAGLGVLLMAALTIVGVTDIQQANAQKNLLATIITTISVAVFIAAGSIAWPQTLCVLFGALAGGFAGAQIARQVSSGFLRTVVIATGLLLSIYYYFAL